MVLDHSNETQIIHSTLLIVMELYKDAQWFLKPPFDLELKHYQCLAIEQKVKTEIDQQRFWPWMSYLPEMLASMHQFRDVLKNQREHWKKSIKGINWEKRRLKYESVNASSELKSVQSILDKAQPLMQQLETDLWAIADEYLSSIEIKLWGLYSGNTQSGFMGIEHQTGLRLYNYQWSSVYSRYGRFSMNYLDTVEANTDQSKVMQHIYQIDPGLYRNFWHIRGVSTLPTTFGLEPIVCRFMNQSFKNRA